MLPSFRPPPLDRSESTGICYVKLGAACPPQCTRSFPTVFALRAFPVQPLLIALATSVALLLAYRFYGRWLSVHVFDLQDDRIMPSEELRDDQDFVPTDRAILLGHHFTSIAGTGPIVGPALAVIWGWLPALLWVVLGSIFVGAVHDLGSLVVSIRSKGQTVGDVAGRVLNPRVQLLFLMVLFLALTIVLAIFGLVIAAVFRAYPSAIFPCLIQIPIAIVIGVYLHRRGHGLLIASSIALVLMYATVIFGNDGVLGELNTAMSNWPVLVWVALLLLYSYGASVLPVWLLLQPRDYINALQLLTALGLVVIGLIVAGLFGGAAITPDGPRIPLAMSAPAFRGPISDAPAMLPFLFVTIACGACSGFHCLVSSGTSSKQLRCETDALPVGYGSMLAEGFLAMLVILACAAGLGLGTADPGGAILTGSDAYLARYSTWTSTSGLAVKIGAFVDGSANFLRAIGVPTKIAIAIMGVMVASFAATTLDTACRLQRYVIQELAAMFAGQRSSFEESVSPNRRGPIQGVAFFFTGKHAATILAISLAMIIAALPAPGTDISLWDAAAGIADVDNPAASAGGLAGIGWWLSTYAGKGGLILWPLFGATNQLLAGLAFLVISFSLWRRGLPVWFVAIPMLFMLAVPAWSLVILIPQWYADPSPNWTVLIIGTATLLLEIWMVVEALLLWPRVRGILEQPATAH